MTENPNDGLCDVPRCRGLPILTYYQWRPCDRCWNRHCDEEDQFDLKVVFKIDQTLESDDTTIQQSENSKPAEINPFDFVK